MQWLGRESMTVDELPAVSLDRVLAKERALEARVREDIEAENADASPEGQTIFNSIRKT